MIHLSVVVKICEKRTQMPFVVFARQVVQKYLQQLPVGGWAIQYLVTFNNKGGGEEFPEWWGCRL